MILILSLVGVLVLVLFPFIRVVFRVIKDMIICKKCGLGKSREIYYRYGYFDIGNEVIHLL